MTVREHVYPLPDEGELAQMVGAATPHFALQIRDRISALIATLEGDHPRRAELESHVARLEALAVGGEPGRAGQAELPPRPSLSISSDQPGQGAAHGG